MCVGVWASGRRFYTTSKTASDYITRSTRPSRFLACNIEKLGVRPGCEATKCMGRFPVHWQSSIIIIICIGVYSRFSTVKHVCCYRNVDICEDTNRENIHSGS